MFEIEPRRGIWGFPSDLDVAVIRGRVVDPRRGDPVSEAVVLVFEGSGHERIGALTDGTGRTGW